MIGTGLGSVVLGKMVDPSVKLLDIDELTDDNIGDVETLLPLAAAGRK